MFKMKSAPQETHARRPGAGWLLPLWLLTACLVGLASPPELRPEIQPEGARHDRVLPLGQLPKDRRLAPGKTLRDYFPFEVPATAAAWEKRASELRRRILVATGLWPMPKKTPLNAVVHGRTERKGFTVEKVYFESYPGHFVTGLLFRPTGKGARRPAVLCPHGHGGRLQDHGPEYIRKLIAAGDERFEGSGRYPKLARCAQLARMGCVTFIYDMVGYTDSTQIPRNIAHRGRQDQPGVDTKDSWRFFTTPADLRLQSIFGLQTYNSIRALDFLTSLPDVDPERVAVTGGSGGGTQTLILGAIDPRPIAAFPQGMVSTAMQGGCVCENTALLRVGTGNVELTALFAPRPQAMTAANDWTQEMMTKGYPELQQLYRLLGAEENVLCKSLVHFGHNYNYVTRGIMYSWFNKHLALGLPEPIVEEDFVPLTEEEWTVWDEEHPRPLGGPRHERELGSWLATTSDRRLAKLTPSDPASLQKYRDVVGAAWATLLGRGLPAAADIRREPAPNKEHAKEDRGDYLEFRDLVRLRPHVEELPVLSLYPKRGWNKQVVIWVDGRGKRAILDAAGSPIPAVRALLESGTAVLAADLLLQGEFIGDAEPAKTVRLTAQRSSAYDFGYNPTLFAKRVHDILTLISFVRHDEHAPEQVHLVGVSGAGPLAAAARSLAGDAIDRTAIDTGGFRFENLESYADAAFLPGAVKYGDVPALLALCAPHKLWIAGEDGKMPNIVQTAYEAAGSPKNVQVTPETRDAGVAAVGWLLGE